MFSCYYLAACTRNKPYGGNRFEKKTGVDSWSKCHQLCRDNKECKVWSWGTAKWCYLRKTTITGLSSTNGYISGTRECDMGIGKILSRIISTVFGDPKRCLNWYPNKTPLDKMHQTKYLKT